MWLVVSVCVITGLPEGELKLFCSGASGAGGRKNHPKAVQTGFKGGAVANEFIPWIQFILPQITSDPAAFGAAGQSGNAPVYPLPDITVKLVPAQRQLHMSWKISGQESKSLSERKNKWENFAAAMKSKIHICFKACISGQYHVIWFYQVSKLCGKNQLCLRFLLKIFLMHKASSGNSLLPFKDAQSLKIIPLL